MKIISLKLKGYKRFALSVNKEIDVIVKEKMVVILGHNGSGKSSLLKELSPLPSNKNDYEQGGYKVIEVEYLGNVYILSSVFETISGKYSFIKNGAEQNPGYTQTTYKELVRSEFRLDSNTFDVLINETSFKYMSLQDRKAWLMRISDNDISFALNFYSKTREQLRDSQGALKIARTKVVQERAKLVDKEEKKHINELISTGNDLIDHLLSQRDNSVYNLSDIEKEIAGLQSSIEKEQQRLSFNLKTSSKSLKLPGLDSIDRTIQNLEADTRVDLSLLKEKTDRIERIQKEVDVFNKTKVKSIDDTLERKNDIQKEIDELVSSREFDIDITNSKETLTSFYTISTNLSEIWTDMPGDPDRVFNNDFYYNTGMKKKEVDKSLENKEKEQHILLNRKETLEDNKKNSHVICPQCNYGWYLKYKDSDYQEVISRLVALGKEREELLKLSEELDESLQTCKKRLDYLEELRTISSKWVILNPIWKVLKNNESLYTNPSDLLLVIKDIEEELKKLVLLENLRTEMSDIDEVLRLLEKDKTKSLDYLNKDHSQLEKELYNLDKKIKERNRKLESLKRTRSQMVSISELKESLENSMKSLENKTKELISYRRRELIDKNIKEVKLFISEKENILSKQNMQGAVVDSLDSNIEELEDKIVYYKAIEKAMSPKEGLIAKSLTGFINSFILQVNSFIKKIWTYPLELNLFEFSDNIDIDYKFRVTVNEKIVVSDISKLSSAQKEIVDLAIRLVSMKYLGMEDYPLFLDEFASRMDKNHRKAAFFTISNLLSTSNFSNIFIISHYEEQYGSLVNAQLVNLSSE